MIDKLEVGKTYVFVSEEAEKMYLKIPFNGYNKELHALYYKNGFTLEDVCFGIGMTHNGDELISTEEYHLFKLKEEKPSYQTSKAFLSEDSKVEQLENKIKRLEAQVKDQDITIKAFKIVVETLQKVLGEKKEM